MAEKLPWYFTSVFSNLYNDIVLSKLFEYFFLQGFYIVHI
jgi:hypothetical protein